MSPSEAHHYCVTYPFINFISRRKHGNLITNPSPAFLSTLRSNLHLSACAPESPYSSLVSTPTTAAFSSNALLAHPTPSPLSISASISQPPSYQVPEPEPLPKHVTSVAGPDKINEREAALRLIADSVAEQRQLTAKAAVLHPYSVTVIVLLASILARYCSLQVLFELSTSLIVITLGVLYWATREYTYLAAGINRSWLEAPHTKSATDNANGHCGSPKKAGKCDDPIVIVSKIGTAIIGALVVRVVKKERKGYVRAWTVDPTQRGKGIGCGLLEEGVRVAWGKGARVMDFEASHANAHHVLPDVFNGDFLVQEGRARRLLTDIVAEHKRERSSR